MMEAFLRSGKLAGLSLGSSKAEVLALLGATDVTSRGDRRGGEIWKYDGFQVAFDREAVCFLGLYFEGGRLLLPPALSLEPGFPAEGGHLQDFQKFLSARRIAFTLDEDFTFDEQTCLRITQSGVGIFFQEGEVHSIQHGRR